MKVSISFSQEAQGVTLHHQNILDRHFRSMEFLQELFKPTLRTLCKDGFLDPEKITTISLLRDKSVVVKKIKMLPLRKIENKQTKLLEEEDVSHEGIGEEEITLSVIVARKIRYVKHV